MKSIVKVIFCAVAVISLGIPVISCTGPKAPNKAVAATVNGVAISRFDLLGEMNAIAPLYIKPGEKKVFETDEKIREIALDRLIYRELAVQEAERQGMKASPGAVAEELKRIKADLKTEAAYRQNLTKTGITEEDLKNRIERNMLVDMITEKEIFGKVTVDLDEARKIHAKRASSHQGPSRPMSFDEARPLIEMELKTAAVQKREDEWVAELKKTARVEIVP